MKELSCKRAILVGHNASFDLNFINEAANRCSLKRNPFHPFSCFDTATLCGLAYGHTVLAKAVDLAGFEWDVDQAHGAAYDAEKTADIFCDVVNRYKSIYDKSMT
jgi:ribonuclease T